MRLFQKYLIFYNQKKLKNQTQIFEGKTRIDCWNAMYEFNDWISKGQKFETLYSTNVLEIKD